MRLLCPVRERKLAHLFGS